MFEQSGKNLIHLNVPQIVIIQNILLLSRQNFMR